jgi:tetratricopeptide (TPR) repeat protein
MKLNVLTLALVLSTSLFAASASEHQAAGNALIKQGKTAAALAQYEKSLALQPNNPKLQAYVKSLKAKQGGSPAPSSPAGGKGPVAVVYSEYARAWMDSKGKNADNVLMAVKGAELALAKLGYSFTRISDKDVEAGKLQNFKLAVLPDSTAMSTKQHKELEKFNAAGKGILMVWEILVKMRKTQVNRRSVFDGSRALLAQKRRFLAPFRRFH